MAYLQDVASNIREVRRWGRTVFKLTKSSSSTKGSWSSSAADWLPRIAWTAFLEMQDTHSRPHGLRMLDSKGTPDAAHDPS